MRYSEINISLLWAEAQNSVTSGTTQLRETEEFILPLIPGHWCFTNGSWKAREMFSGQDWYNTLEGFEGLMGARNTRACISPLHSEMEALIWATKSMRNLRQYHVIFVADCIQLVKMVSAPEDQPLRTIWTTSRFFKKVLIIQRSFISFER